MEQVRCVTQATSLCLPSMVSKASGRVNRVGLVSSHAATRCDGDLGFSSPRGDELAGANCKGSQYLTEISSSSSLAELVRF